MRAKILSRVVWITGASSGIGKALAEVFAELGDTVIATSRRTQALKDLQHSMKKHGTHCEIAVCDVRREKEINNAARAILRRHKKIDILVNNAGVTSFNEFLKTSTREFDEILNTNLRSLFLTSKAVVPTMVKRKQGSIINILSYAAKTTYSKSVAYSAAKSGAEALMNVVRAEVREKGVKVVNIYPGAVLTPMWPATFRKKHSPMMMSARDIAKLVHHVSLQPSSVHIEELVVRPPSGDLKV